MTIAPGTTAEVEYTVALDRTAHAIGNPGVKVLGTPFLIGLLENAAAKIVHPHLPPGASTVGTMVEIRHLAATPVGMKVTAKATLLETDGRRYLFAVEAWDEKEKVTEGKHERFFVANLEKFLERTMRKGQS